MRTTFISLIAAAALAAPAAAADDGVRTTTFIVTASDLASPQSKAEIDRRIEAAINELCVTWEHVGACRRKVRNQIRAAMSQARSRPQALSSR